METNESASIQENRRNIWEHLYENMYSNTDGIKIEDILNDVDGYRPNDLVQMWEDEENHTCTIYIGRWRKETDEEYQKRMDEIERVKASADKIKSPEMMVSIDEYTELKEKAWKYDQLNK